MVEPVAGVCVCCRLEKPNLKNLCAEENASLLEMFQSCTRLEVSKNGKKSQAICESCEEDLQQAHTILSRFRKSYAMHVEKYISAEQ